MEMATGLFLSLFGGGAAAGGAAAAGAAATSLVPGIGAAAGAAAASSGVSIGSALLKGLAIGSSVLGAVAQIGAGRAEQAQYEAEARNEQFEAKNEFIEGREAAADLKRRLLQTVSGQAVAFARGGVSLGSVSVTEARNQATSDAERELTVNSNSALSRELQRRRRATNLRVRGENAAAQGNIGAAMTVLQGGMKLAEIG